MGLETVELELDFQQVGIAAVLRIGASNKTIVERCK